MAKILNVNRKTIAARLRSLANEARAKQERRTARVPVAVHLQFDDLETFEHTKLKPLSVTLAVEHPTRRILGFEVSQMPAKGLLASRSVKKYGRRPDERTRGRRQLFERLKTCVAPNAEIESDMNPHYPKVVREFFPDAQYTMHKGQRGSIVGQGELKRIRFDPLFSLNHTCAMKRHSVSRLVRRTWTTTKIPARLADHLAIYAEYHNSELIE